MKLALALASLLSLAPTAAIAQSSFPPGFVPTEIRRFVVDNWATWDHITGGPGQYGPPYSDEAHLGWISSQPFSGSRELYVCQNNFPKDEYFTSAYPDCEGRGTRLASPYVLGHAASSQISGTVPLYRCVSGKNEFDSTHPQCEGQRVVGILAYVFP